MEGLKKISPILFLIFLLVAGAAISLVLCCGMYFVPANQPLFTAAMAVIGLIAAYFAILGKNIHYWGKNIILSLIPFGTMFFSLFYIYGTKSDNTHIFAVTLSVTYFVVSFLIFYVCAYSKKTKVIMTAVFAVIIVLPMTAVFAVTGTLASQKAQSAIGRADSPDGKYTAEASKYYVSIIPRYRAKNLGIAVLQPFEHIVYQSENGDITAEDVTINNEAVIVRGIEHSFKYIGGANLFYDFSQYSQLLNVYIPQRYYNEFTAEYDQNISDLPYYLDSLDYKQNNLTLSYYLYSLDDEEVTLVNKDIAENKNWGSLDSIKKDFAEKYKGLNIDGYDSFCYMSKSDYIPGVYNPDGGKGFIMVLYSSEYKTELVIDAELSPNTN